jgi:gas vesicle protein
MKTVTELRETAKERMDDFTDSGRKAAYAVMGAPVIAGRRIADYAGKVGSRLQKELDAWITEGERLAGELREGKVVTEIKERVDIDQLQGRVEKLKDQLEDVLTNWRDTFKPGEKDAVEDTKPEAKKPAAKKTTAKSSAKKDAATTEDEENAEA